MGGSLLFLVSALDLGASVLGGLFRLFDGLLGFPPEVLVLAVDIGGDVVDGVVGVGVVHSLPSRRNF